MKTTIYKTIFLIALFIQVAENSQGQTSEQLFQKGIMKEEGEGSLKEAIELYKSVADNTKADKVLRAKALYQMGNCYEKLGQQEARGIYEKLVANYNDPQELIAIAKRKLSNLNGSNAISDKSGIILRQIWSPVKDGCDPISVSPDGRYIVYHDYKSVQVGIQDLRTQKEWEITTKGTWEEPVVQYPGDGGSIWSPDSRQIAYPWVVNPNKKNQYAELHIVNFDGSNDRLILKEEKFDGPYPMVWSSDGKIIIGLNYSRNNPNAFLVQIFSISVDDGSEKIITQLENRKIGNITFSPDGNQIIFSAQTVDGSENYDIYMISKEGGPIASLVTNKEEDNDPIHVPGTNHVLFFSKHSGFFDLCAMNLIDGKLEGEHSVWFLPYVSPQWTTDEKGLIVKAWTKEGENGLFQIDIATGKYTKLKTSNLPDQKKWQSYWVWKEPQFSPDGETIYYTSAIDSSSSNEPLNLIAYSVNSGTEQIISPFEKEIRQRTISPDGKMIACSHTFTDKNSLYVISLEGDRKVKKIAGFEENTEVYPIGWTPDSQKAILAKQNASGEIEIWSVPFETNNPTLLFSDEKLKAFKGAIGLKIQYVGQNAYLTMKDGGIITELWAMDNIVQK